MLLSMQKKSYEDPEGSSAEPETERAGTEPGKQLLVLGRRHKAHPYIL